MHQSHSFYGIIENQLYLPVCRAEVRSPSGVSLTVIKVNTVL